MQCVRKEGTAGIHSRKAQQAATAGSKSNPTIRTQKDLEEVPLHINRLVYDRRKRIESIAFRHTRRGSRERR